MVALPLPDLPEEISALRILALDLRWTWSHEHDAFWERIDPRLWRRMRNPWSVLQSASAAARPACRARGWAGSGAACRC